MRGCVKKYSLQSVVEQPDSCKSHCYLIFITACNDQIVSDGTSRLGNVFHAALVGAFNIVSERKECVGAERDPCHLTVSYTHLTLPTKRIV